MAPKINEAWLDIDTDAIAILNRKSAGGNASRTLSAIIAYTEKVVTRRVQALPNSFIDDDIELDENGYYKSIVLEQFSTNYCLYKIMLSYTGSGNNNPEDVYWVKAQQYKEAADELLPEIVEDTVNNDGSEPVDNPTNGLWIAY